MLREIIALHICFYLFGRSSRYEIFDSSNALVRLWVKQMPVPAVVYFKFVYHYIRLYFDIVLAIKASGSDEGDFLKAALTRAKESLQQHARVGRIACNRYIYVLGYDFSTCRVVICFLLFILHLLRTALRL